MPHPLAAILERAAAGPFPAADGGTDVLPADDDGGFAIVAFTGHAYVLADVDPTELAKRQTDASGGGGFGGALAPAVQQWLAGDDREIGSIDVVLAATGGLTPAATLQRRDDRARPPSRASCD